jgi:hypothetical protein
VSTREPRKIVSGLDFYLWQTEPPYGNGGVFYGGSHDALLRLSKNVVELADGVRAYGSGFRQFLCKRPERAIGGLPYGAKERAPPPMSFADVERRYSVKFTWYRALTLRVGKGSAGVRVDSDEVHVNIDAETFLWHFEQRTHDDVIDLSFGNPGLRYSPDWLGIE